MVRHQKEKQDRQYRLSASFGKRQEFIAIAELLKHGFDVYLTLVDDQQIDCVVRKEVNTKPVYLDVQIKARSKDCDPKNAGRFAAMQIRKPRSNYFFIFYSEQADAYWVMTSKEVVEKATRNKTGKNIGKYTINFTGLRQGCVTRKPEYEPYRNRFELLREYRG